MNDTKKLRILFLCSWYPHLDNPTNGIFIKRHAYALSQFHDITVLFVKSTSQVSESTSKISDNNGVKEIICYYPKLKHNFPAISSLLKLKKFKSESKKAIDALADEAFDIIHVNVIFPAAIQAVYALKKYPYAKLFITEHWSGYLPEDGSYKGYYQTSLTKHIVRQAKAIFTVSEKLKLAMQSHQLNGKYELINNVVDTNIFKPHDTKPKTSELKILHVSSLVDREKNISGIISVVKQLAEKNMSFSLTIVGDNDEEKKHYDALILENKLQTHITFVGYKSEQEIANLMNEADVFLLFSHYESMPVVLLEAMACGLLVIATNVGQISQMVMPEFGIILKDSSEENCAKQLIEFKRAHFSDKESMHSYVEKNYGVKAVSNTISKIYFKYLQ